ncbi:MAG: acyl-CoA dehydrogenase family protein [Chloroflexi bacterium]|nr:acyl-CoA dehydrogenase family protein [Chloroflexota bacterium]
MSSSKTNAARRGRPPMPRASDPVAVARSLAPVLRAAGPTIERDRRVPLDLVDRMRDAGLFHMLIPKALGGAEVDPVVASQAIEEIAAGDASAAWVLMLAMQSNAFSGFMEERYALEVWGNGGIICGTARPIGRAVATSDPEEGYVVSGRWPFASGSSHADWFMAECLVYDGDLPRNDAAGDHLSRMLFVHRDDVTVIDTWDATGLRGTASNDFEVHGVFVPHGRGLSMMALHPTQRWALYANPPVAFVNHGAHALGIARAALGASVELISEKRGWGNVPLREVPRMQGIVTEATAEIEAARAFLYDASRELWAAALEADGQAPALLRSRAGLAASHAMTASLRTVDLLHRSLGTTSSTSFDHLDRCFRDLHTAAAHVMVGPLTYEAAGRVELDMDADFPLF